MKKVGELAHGVRSYNTCDCQGRVFNFTSNDGKLVVSEVILGEEVKVRRVNTEVDCKCSDACYSSCCPFGDKILLIAGERDSTDSFCAVVSIDPGKLTQESIHIEKKKVIGWERYEDILFIIEISDNDVWASFLNSGRIWIGEIKGNELLMTKHSDQLPAEGGFCTVPLRLPDERLLVAGGWPLCTAITAITAGDHFSFEKVGDMPGEGRYCVSTALVVGRFVVGFGGWAGVHMDKMWIFDLQTGETSPVAKEGEWHPATYWSFLAINDGILYVVGGEGNTGIHSITLQCLSELIQDLDFQYLFQRALGLELRRYPTLRRECGEFRGMRDLGGYFYGYLSHNTVNHQGRVFHFSQREGKLCVTEILFGPWLKTRTVNTDVDCKTDDDKYLSCCSFGGKILVMTGDRNETDMFCVLVNIEPGELASKSIHLEEKRIVGLEAHHFEAYLVQIAENKVWISFNCSDEIWIGEIKGEELAVAKHPDHLPMAEGFDAPPLRLQDGKFLAAGGWPPSRAITLITLGQRFSFEKIGDMPGKERSFVSIILVKERFVVGFGGWNDNYVDDMWIFDIKTRKISSVKKEGEWHPSCSSPVLAVRDKELYVIGGSGASSAHCLSFSALSHLIHNGGVRTSFCRCLGLQFQPGRGFERRTLSHHISLRL